MGCSLLLQRTLKNTVTTTGIGLHSGNKVTITLRPAANNTGIIFRRIDLNPIINIKVSPDTVGETMLCTTLTKNKTKIGTIEHLMSALAGLGIDNVYIELDAAEVPIMDGSAAPFIYLILSAGIQEQHRLKKFIRIKSPIKFSNGNAWAKLTPYDGFRASFQIDFNHPAIRNTAQFIDLDFANISYAKEISRARTFGFMSDIERLRSKNLGLGGSFHNAVVLDDYRILNKDGLRYKDEFVRHKILDAIGDLYTSGYSILGAFHGHKAGHAINNLLLRELQKNPQSWELVEFDNQTTSPIQYAHDYSWIAI